MKEHGVLEASAAGSKATGVPATRRTVTARARSGKGKTKEHKQRKNKGRTKETQSRARRERRRSYGPDPELDALRQRPRDLEEADSMEELPLGLTHPLADRPPDFAHALEGM